MRPPYSHQPRGRYLPPPPPSGIYSFDRSPYEAGSRYRRDGRSRPYSPPPPHYSNFSYRPYQSPPLPHCSTKEPSRRRIPPKAPYRYIESDRRHSSRPKIDESVRVVENGKSKKETMSNSSSSKPLQKQTTSTELQESVVEIKEQQQADEIQSSSSNNQQKTKEERELAKKEQVVFLDIEEEEEHLMQFDSQQKTSARSTPNSDEGQKLETTRLKTHDEGRYADRETSKVTDMELDGNGEEKSEEKIPKPWTKYISDKGEPYYHNRITNQTVWTLREILLETPKNERAESRRVRHNAEEDPERNSRKIASSPNKPSVNNNRKRSLSNNRDRYESRDTNSKNPTYDKRHLEKDVESKAEGISKQNVDGNGRQMRSLSSTTKTSRLESKGDNMRKTSGTAEEKSMKKRLVPEGRPAASSSTSEGKPYLSRPKTIERDAYGKIKVTTRSQLSPSRSRIPSSPPSNGRQRPAAYPINRTELRNRSRLSPSPSMPPIPPPRGFHPYEREYSRHSSSRRYSGLPLSPPPPPSIPPTTYPAFHTTRHSRPIDRYSRYPSALEERHPPMPPAYDYNRSSLRSPPPRWHPRESDVDRRSHELYISRRRPTPPPLPPHHHHQHSGRGYR
ncbi:hypothetical protein BDF20DRAFT_913183 [Mycotypha africana]|uniref:uncharacterized protein n=1 Tax=Mycotypha africana TaxID=64632 RepID=UPI002300DB2F|nr:uncharacterized protein BDF20DRAFT_913183 [Mycotypha africana]KAI8979643.1 hypothetical protein BDF20DRAFT_913183 [Mycotypha africana]